MGKDNEGYLVLSRKFGESIELTYEDMMVVKIKIGDIGRGQVQILIKAPRTVKIRRSELPKN